MNNTVRISEENVTEALENANKIIQEYRNEVLKEFLLKATNLDKDLTSLLKKGVDEEHRVSFNEEDRDGNTYMYTMDKEFVEKVKALLDNMNENNAIEDFKYFVGVNFRKFYDMNIWVYEDFSDMEKLAKKYSKYDSLLGLIIQTLKNFMI